MQNQHSLKSQARVFDARDVGLDHLLDELLERRRARVPASSLFNALAGDTDEKIDLGGAEVAFVHANEGAAGGDFDTDLVDALALEA